VNSSREVDAETHCDDDTHKAEELGHPMGFSWDGEVSCEETDYNCTKREENDECKTHKNTVRNDNLL
jgi:hypothetical protein